MLHVFINNKNRAINNIGFKMTTKYLKFGLRADKNLSDLTNPNTALTNILDNISNATDESGAKTGFTVEDVSPVQELRNTGLADSTNAAGQSTDIIDLNDSLARFTVGVGSTLTTTSTDVDGNVTTVPIAPGTVLEIEPRRTLQDHISNFKSVLGDPPWIDGGDGPIARFVTADRINETISFATTGNLSSSAIDSLGTNLFSTSLVSDYRSMVYPVDFWNDGVFDFAAKLHPSFPDTYGLIQWIGYLSGDYSQVWESTGLFMIEEDVVDAGNENNWVKLKSVFNFSQAITLLTFTDDGSTTTINLAPGKIGTTLGVEKYVCNGMIVRKPGQTYASAKNAGQIVENMDIIAKTCTVPVTGFSGTLTFDHVGGLDPAESPIVFTPQKRGNRLRVRYTVWYPTITDDAAGFGSGNPTGANYQIKKFSETSQNTDKLPFNRLYSSFDRNQVFGPFTYKYFEDGKASPLNQLSTSPIRVNNTLSMPYTIPTLHSNKLVGVTGNNTAVTMKTVTIIDTFGKVGAANWDGCLVGDWVTFKNGSTYYTYQILEISGQNNDGSVKFAYLKDTIESDTSIAVNGTFSAMIWKNLGLVGVYKLSSSGNASGSLYKMSGEGALPAKVYEDMLLFGVADNGTSNSTTRRRTTVSTIAGSQNTITVSGGNLSGPAGGSIVAVYASRGLDDKSSVLACAGVYGREVEDTTSSGNSVKLTTTVGVSVNDFVQFEGSNSGSPIITYGTTVASVVDANFITLSASVNSALNAASTLVFIKAANDPGNVVATRNKEFCIIPLNTAPPFAGTALGLATPASNANLEVEGLAFGELAITLPTNHIVSISPPTNAAKYFPLQTSSGTTYKILMT